MMMVTTTSEGTHLSNKRWTQAEFHELPEGPPFYELEDRELIKMPPPRGRHQKVVGELYTVVSVYLKQHKLGDIWLEVEVDITSTSTYVPNLSYLVIENLDKFKNDLHIIGPPDLVIEVPSLSTTVRDQTIKRETYQLAGVPWYWLVDQDLLITELKLTPDGYLVNQTIAPGKPFSPGVLPGLTFNLAELMGEPPTTQEADEQQ